VLSDSAYGLRFETGDLPPGVDPAAGQLAATVAVICGALAVAGIAAAMCLRTTKIAVAVASVELVGLVPFVPLAFFTWALTH
jgi:uncharacterized membrane protein YadS